MRLLSCVLVIAACKDSPAQAPPDQLPTTLPFEIPAISTGFTPFELASHAAILVPPHAIVIEVDK